MFFLDFVWWNPLTWISEGLEKLQGAIMSAVRALSLSVNSIIYRLLIDLYTLFEALCSARILDEEVLENLATRVGYILGVVMLFFVIVSFIRILLDPDAINDKNKGAFNVIKKVLLVIVMLGVSNYTFTLLFSIQKTVVKSHVISKLLLPYDVDTQHFGGALSAELFTSFYNVSLDYLDEDGNVLGTDENVRLCQQEVYTLKERITENGDFSLADVCLMAYTTYTGADGEERQGYIIDYNWLICFGVGLYTVYLLGSYCISVGIRMIQLAFLEIISPMAIVSYLSPKQDSMFSKWTKIYTSTYLDVFIRIAIINFMIYLIALVFGSGTDQTFWNSFTITGSNPIGTRRLLTIVMVLALLAFAKKAPELLQDLFPAGASKLGFGGIHMKDMLGGTQIKSGLRTGAKVATAGTAIGLLGAAASGYSRYKINRKNGGSVPRSLLGGAGGALSAIPRGLKAGAAKGNIFSNVSKGWENQRSVDDKYDELITGGGSTLGRVTSHLSAHFGETKGQMYTRVISNNEQIAEHVKNIEDTADKFSSVKVAKTNWENAKARGDSDADIKRLYDAYKDEKDRMTTLALSGRDVGSVKDQVVAEQIKISQADISSMISSGKVVLKRADGTQIGSGDVNSSVAMDDISIASSHNISSIKMQSDYSAAIQNDKSAGVNSNKKQ